MQRIDTHDRETLLSRLRIAALGAGKITFLNNEDDERDVSYRDLYRRALTRCRALVGVGVRPGDEVVLQIEDNEAYLVALWACMLARAIAVPLTVGKRDEQANKVCRIWRLLENPWLITTADQFERLRMFWTEQGEDEGRLRARTLPWVGVPDAASGFPLESEPNNHRPEIDAARPDDIAFLQFSSGSTGDPKGVVLTHRNLLANCRSFIDRARVGPSDVPLGWMPLTHDMGLIGTHLGSVVSGLSQTLMPTVLFIRRPLLWLQRAHAQRATILSSPNFGLQYALSAFRSSARQHEWDLRAVRLIWNGAEPISPELCADFMETFARFGLPGHAMYPCYGLAEATVAVALQDPGEGIRSHRIDRGSIGIGKAVRPAETDEAAVSFTECGYALACCEIRIGDAAGDSLPPGHIGHILIRGASVTQGYYRNAEATARITSPAGWLDTGDLGFLTDAGRLVVTGRTKEIIIINGVNLCPHDIERIIETVDAVAPGQTAVCGVPGHGRVALAAFVTFRNDAAAFAPVASAVRRRVLEQTGMRLDHVLPVSRIPRTTSGKAKRFKLAEAFAAGAFDATAPNRSHLHS